MGAIDWILLVILAVSAFMGWRKGLLAAIVNLAGVILSFFLVGHFYPLVANSLRLKFGMSGILSNILAIVLIIVLLAVLVRIIIAIFNRVLKSLKLSGINRFFGLLLGLGNGLLIIICLMVVLDYFPKTSDPLKDGSSHRVYAGINVIKDDIFSSLNLRQQLNYLQGEPKEETPKEGSR